MSENRFLAAIKRGNCPLQAWMWNPSALFAEIIARAGFDSVSFDFQHGSIDFSDFYAMAAIVSANGSTPMVRIPSPHDLGWVSRALDGGAYGVICPDVRTADEARAFAAACKYAPEGQRGFGPVRPALGTPKVSAGGYAAVSAGYNTAAENAAVMAIVQIESPEGLNHIEAIMATPGVDAVFPGMVDYSLLAYGEVLTDFNDPRLRKPVEQIIKVAHAMGKPVGLPAITLDAVPVLLELGADWLQVGNDVAWISAAARQSLAGAQAAITKAGKL